MTYIFLNNPRVDREDGSPENDSWTRTNAAPPFLNTTCATKREINFNNKNYFSMIYLVQ